MTMPCFNQEELFQFLNRNGYEVISNDFWEEFDIVMVGNGNSSFPLTVRQKYFYPTVVIMCQQLGIDPPVEMLKVYNQDLEYKKKNKK